MLWARIGKLLLHIYNMFSFFGPPKAVWFFPLPSPSPPASPPPIFFLPFFLGRKRNVKLAKKERKKECSGRSCTFFKRRRRERAIDWLRFFFFSSGSCLSNTWARGTFKNEPILSILYFYPCVFHRWELINGQFSMWVKTQYSPHLTLLPGNPCNTLVSRVNLFMGRKLSISSIPASIWIWYHMHLDIWRERRRELNMFLSLSLRHLVPAVCQTAFPSLLPSIYIATVVYTSVSHSDWLTDSPPAIQQQQQSSVCQLSIGVYKSKCERVLISMPLQTDRPQGVSHTGLPILLWTFCKLNVSLSLIWQQKTLTKNNKNIIPQEKVRYCFCQPWSYTNRGGGNNTFLCLLSFSLFFLPISLFLSLSLFSRVRVTQCRARGD